MRKNTIYILASTLAIAIPAQSSAEIQNTQAPSQSVPNEGAVAADNGIGVSNGKLALVKVVRPTKAVAKSDPLTEFGAGFTIVAFNKTGQPVQFGPESVVVKDAQGRACEILTPERIAELKQKKAENHRALGTFFSIAAGALGAVGSASNNAATAASGAALMAESVAAIQIANNSANAELSQTDALASDYNTGLIASSLVSPLHAASGSVRVNGVRDKDPATIIVTINGEVHEIHFDKGRKG